MPISLSHLFYLIYHIFFVEDFFFNQILLINGLLKIH